MGVSKIQNDEAASGSQGDDLVVVPTEGQVHIRTIIAVIAVNFATFGQLVCLVGSGFLSQTMAGLLGDDSKSVWFSTAITIGTIALNPPISQAADFWGRKWFVVVLNAMAVPGCIVVSRAQNVGTCIAGFCLIGISFGTQSTLSAIVSEILPRRHRGIGQASVNIATSLGGVFALLVGGALIRNDPGNFRTYWYIGCGAFVLATIGIVVGYNPPPRTEQRALTNFQKIRMLDWVGFLLITAGLTLFAVGLQFAGNPFSWTSAAVLAPLIVGLCLLIAFCFYEWLGRTDGLVHHGLFRDRNFAIALVAIFTEGLSFLTSTTYFAFEAAVLSHVTLFDAALRFCILFIGGVISAPLAGMVITRTKLVREPLAFGFAMLLAYNACMTSIAPGSGQGPFWGFPVLGSIGLGFILTTVTTAAQMSAPPELISVTTGLLVSCRSVGGTIALAINNAIFSNSMNDAVPSRIAGAVLPLGFPIANLKDLIQALLSNDPAAVAKVNGVTQEVGLAAEGALFEAYATSFRHVWIAATCFCAAGFISSCFFRNDKSEFTGAIDAPLEATPKFGGDGPPKSVRQSEHVELAAVERVD